jgi:hypothetical protein
LSEIQYLPRLSRFYSLSQPAQPYIYQQMLVQ